MNKIVSTIEKSISLIFLYLFWLFLGVLLFALIKYFYLSPLPNYEYDFIVLPYVYLFLMAINSFLLHLSFELKFKKKLLIILLQIGYLSICSMFVHQVIDYCSHIISPDYFVLCTNFCFSYPKTILGYTYGIFNPNNLYLFFHGMKSFYLYVFPSYIIFILSTLVFYFAIRYKRNSLFVLISERSRRLVSYSIGFFYLNLFFINVFFFTSSSIMQNILSIMLSLIAFSILIYPKKIEWYSKKWVKSSIKYYPAVSSLFLLVSLVISLFDDSYLSKPNSIREWFQYLFGSKAYLIFELGLIICIVALFVIIIINSSKLSRNKL